MFQPVFSPPQKHNKSGVGRIMLATIDDDLFDEWYAEFLRRPKLTQEGHCRMSHCKLFSNTDGRFSYKQKKVTFGYHLVARRKYGLVEIQKVSSTKSNDNNERGRTISHLCGTPFCLHPDHIIIEWKDIQDQRACCHFAMKNWRVTTGIRMPIQILNRICPHTPKCGAIVIMPQVFCQPCLQN